MEPILLADLRWPLAYIDPGTGQALLYLFGALAAGLAFRFRQARQWVSARFSRRGGE